MAQDTRIGTTLAGYRIESLIGRGGMGTVYLAEHMGLQRKVALKVLSADLAGDTKFRERFVRESRLAASIEDPNIVPIYEAGDSDEVLFIAMRYVRGTDLKALIEAQGTLPPERTNSIIAQVASALDAAHQQGLIHRDVKPANILVVPGDATRPDKVYLSDFGLTKRASSDSGLTATGQFVGTLDYAAPEQFEGKPLSPQTDVYSLGCVVYECLTGEVPFPRGQDAARMYAHLMEPAPKVTDKRPELPAGIDGVVARAMAKRPEDPFRTAGDLAAAAGAETPRPAAAGPDMQPARRRRILLAVTAALLVLIAIGGVFALRNGKRSGEIKGAASTPTGASTTPGSISAEPDSVLRIDPNTNKVSADIRVGSQPQAVAFSGGNLWVVNWQDHTISRIDPHTNQVFSTQGGLTSPCNLAPDPGGGVWVTNCLARPYVVARLDPITGQAGESIPLPDVPAGVAFGGEDVWVALLPPGHPPGTVLRIDPSTKRIVKTFRVGTGAEYVAFGVGGLDGALWVGNADDGTVSKIDAHTNRVTATIPVGNGAYLLTAGDGYVWVENRFDHSTSKIDPFGNRVVDIIQNVRGTMAIQGSSLWVADPEAPTLWRIDTSTDGVTAQFDLPYSGFIAAGAGSVWVSAPATFDDQCCR